MAANPLQEQVARAVLDFLTEGSFPDDEKIVSSTFDARSCDESLLLISDEKRKTEDELSVLSHDSIFKVDGWIRQAKQLQEDIERSRNTARNIVSQYETGKKLQARAHDTSRKVELLQKEIALNEVLTREFLQARSLRDQAAQLDEQISKGDLPASLHALNGLKHSCQESRLPAHNSFGRVLRETISNSEKRLLATVVSRWDALVRASLTEQTLFIHGDLNTLEVLVSTLNELGGLNEIVQRLEQNVTQFLQKAFAVDDGLSYAILIGDNGVTMSQHQTPIDLPMQLDNVVAFLHFLHDRLPHDMSATILSTSASLLTSDLILHALSHALPDDVLGMNEYQRLIDRAHAFSEELRALDCSEQDELERWSDSIPRLWLGQRRGLTLDQLRSGLWKAIRGELKIVDLVETRRVREDLVNENSTTEDVVDDWAVNWEVDESSQALESTKPSEENNIRINNPGHDDKNHHDGHDDGNDDNAWDWGDDNLEIDTDGPEEAQTVPDKSFEKERSPPNNSKESLGDVLALKEHYFITSVPDLVLGLIVRQVTDFELLSTKECSDLTIKQCGPGLLTLPTLVLALYRAIAPSIYTQTYASGNMYIHNDCKYLAGRLREIIYEHSLARLEPDAAEIERFGKLCYSSEMQSHRVILMDVLEGAKGFGNCSSQPMMEDCRIAINSVCEHIRAAHAAWLPVLWKSALLQAVASLISTVIEKIIVTVEDLGDISASDSQYLVTLYTQISELEDLFLPEGATEAEKESGMVTPMTAVYVPKWLKFQYLINILESSLADIKYLWIEGELSLEYTEDEIVDLLEALFADSEHRRKAISEIKRSSKR
ncbi:ribosome biogenesis protein ytm1 [Ascosphaera pollenicola]|nr:ribosome biogenesis protein ytm1 [Ascosphaera pollenicola]